MLVACLSAASATSNRLFIIGSACESGWDIGRAPEMTRIGDNLFFWKGKLDSSGEFKFLPAREWALSYTPQIAEPGNKTLTDGEITQLYPRLEHENDNKFRIDQSGIYNVIADLEAMEMVCTLEEKIPELFLFGTACDIDNNPDRRIAMKLEDTGNFTWSGNLRKGTDLVFLTSGALYPRYAASEASELTGTDITVSLTEITAADTENRIKVSRGGDYSVEVNPDNMSATFTFHPEELHICGNALCGRQGVWHQTEQYIKPMEPTATEHLFRWSGYLYAIDNDDNRAEFKFRKGGADNGSWDGFVSATAQNQAVEPGQTYPIADTASEAGRGDRKFEVPENGIYTVFADTEALTMTIYSGEVGTDRVAAPLEGISVVGRTITVSSASERHISIYNTTGRLISSVIMADGQIELPSSGLYVIVADGTARKFLVR